MTNQKKKNVMIRMNELLYKELCKVARSMEMDPSTAARVLLESYIVMMRLPLHRLLRPLDEALAELEDERQQKEPQQANAPQSSSSNES